MKSTGMKVLAGLAVLLVTAVTIGIAAEKKDAAQANAAEAELFEKISYGIGMGLGKDFKAREIPINPDMLLKGLQDALAGSEPMVSEEEVMAALKIVQKQAEEKQRELLAELGAKNKAEGEKFLAENAQREGVVTTASGLQYEVIQAGSGRTPGAEDTVEVDYSGTFVDGTKFDSSYDRGEAVSFPVGGVIPGWTEALQLMQEGAKWKIYVPADLAYGENGFPPTIAPNSTLVFEMELHKVL